MSESCYIDVLGCEVCPAVPAQPGTPARPPRFEQAALLGWDAGALSVESLSGSLRLSYTVAQSAGIICGLANPTADPADPFSVDHGFHTFVQAGVSLARPFESGAAVGAPVVRAAGATLEVLRGGPRVTYLVNGVTVHVSAKASAGQKVALAVLYASGDEVSGAEFVAVDPFNPAQVEASAPMAQALMSSVSSVLIAAAPMAYGEVESSADVTAVVDATAPMAISRIYGVEGAIIDAAAPMAYGSIRQSFDVPPAADLILATSPMAYGDIRLSAVVTIEVDATAPMATFRAYGVEPGVLDARAPMATASVLALGPPEVMFILPVAKDADAWLWFGSQYVHQTESLTLDDSATVAGIAIAIRERFGLVGVPGSLLSATARMSEGFALGETLGIVWRLLMAESLVLDGTLAATLTVVRRVEETLVLSDIAGSMLEARMAIAEALVLEDSKRLSWYVLVAEALAITGSVTERVRAVARVLESLALTANEGAVFTVAAVVRDSLVLGHGTDTLLDAIAVMHESLAFVARISYGGAVYETWLINTESKGVGRYTNYPFNSYGRLGKHQLACGDTGLFRLGGSTDDGAPIPSAVLRSALDDFGSRKVKGMPGFYLGLMADGGMVLKVVTTSQHGEKIEDWFRVARGKAAEIREARAKIARGIRSVYWGWELITEPGTRAEIDVTEWLTMTTSRKIS